MKQINCFVDDETYEKVIKIVEEENNSVSRVGGRLIKKSLAMKS